MDRGSGAAYGDDMMAIDGFTSASCISKSFIEPLINSGETTIKKIEVCVQSVTYVCTDFVLIAPPGPPAF
jgi:hypothetical protein